MDHESQIEAIIQAYPNTLGSLRMNVTRNQVYNQNTLYSYITKQEEYLDIATYLKNMEKQFVDKEEYQQYCALFCRENLLQAFQKGQYLLALTHHFLFKDNRERWITTSGRLLQNPDTKDVEMFVFATETTDQVITQQIAQQLVNKSYDIVALIYPAQNQVDFRFAGNEYEEMPEVEILEYEENRQTAAKTLFEGEESQKYLDGTDLNNLQKSLDEQGKFSFTNSRKINGKTHYKNYSYTYLDEQRKTILCVVQDITDIYEKEEEQMQRIQNALLEAEKANAAKTMFLSNMSHDIRTPMNAIINMTNLARDDVDNKKELLNDLDKIQTSSNFLLSLINDILDMSKIGSSKMELAPEVYEYQDFLDAISSVFVPLCRNKDLTFHWEKGSTNVALYIDKLRFNQIFFNLLSNAIKYTPAGGTVWYGVKNTVIKDNKLSCDFYIKDTGRGMSREFQEKMFRPFERELHAGDKITGTGLGLSIAKSMVELMGGTMTVESEEGKGTTFCIQMQLPLATKEQIDAAKAKENSEKPVNFAGKHVLIAEDHPLNREIITRLLAKEKIIVESAQNGKECVELFKKRGENYFDAILMDIRMPVMDGLEATKCIRTMDRADAKTIPIIAMTANAFSEDRAQSMESGMNDHLSKPVDSKEMFRTLGRYIGNVIL